MASIDTILSIVLVINATQMVWPLRVRRYDSEERHAAANHGAYGAFVNEIVTVNCVCNVSLTAGCEYALCSTYSGNITYPGPHYITTGEAFTSELVEDLIEAALGQGTDSMLVISSL